MVLFILLVETLQGEHHGAHASPKGVVLCIVVHVGGKVFVGGAGGAGTAYYQGDVALDYAFFNSGGVPLSQFNLFLSLSASPASYSLSSPVPSPPFASPYSGSSSRSSSSSTASEPRSSPPPAAPPSPSPRSPPAPPVPGHDWFSVLAWRLGGTGGSGAGRAGRGLIGGGVSGVAGCLDLPERPKRAARLLA